MKVLALIASLLVSAYGLSDSDLTCTETTFALTGTQADYPDYNGGEIAVGTCFLDSNFGLPATAFAACGLTKSVKGNVISYKGSIESPAPTGIITRKKTVMYTLTCSFDTATGTTATASIVPRLEEITGAVSQEGGAIDMSLNLLDANGNVVASGDSLKVDVGVNVDAQVVGSNLGALGLKAYAKTCFVTPSASRDDAVKYTMLQDYCTKDSTLKVAADGDGQKLSFTSFVFSANTKAPVYLHCDLVACEGVECGVCAGAPKRRRRSMMAHTMMRKMMTVRLM